VYLQLLDGPLETDTGSLPGVVPLNSSQIVLTEEAQVPVIVAVPPKLGLIPASTLPLYACLSKSVSIQSLSIERWRRGYLDVLDHDGARNRVLAVTARTVQLAKVHGGETVDSDSTLAVVLNDLVVRTLGTSTFDERIAVTLNTERVFADIDPPDILDGAGSFTVNTLDLICKCMSALSKHS
jgi:hypothetical protein